MDKIADKLWLQMMYYSSLGLLTLEPMRDIEGFYSVEVLKFTLEAHQIKMNRINDSTLIGLTREADDMWFCFCKNRQEKSLILYASTIMNTGSSYPSRVPLLTERQPEDKSNTNHDRAAWRIDPKLSGISRWRIFPIEEWRIRPSNLSRRGKT